MNDQVVKRQRRLSMLCNLVVFTLIFGLFGTIIYTQLHTSLYGEVDELFEHTCHMIMEREDFIEEQLTPFFELEQSKSDRTGETVLHDGADGELSGAEPGGDPPGEPEIDLGAEPPADPGAEPVGDRRALGFISMRVQVAVRDAEGEIVNSHSLGRSFWEYQLDEMPFSADELGGIRTDRLESGAALRSLAIATQSASGELYYVQLFVNVDAEQAILDNFLHIIIACVTVCVVLSLAASYILTQMSMAPIIRSWNRQTEFVENASHELRTPLTIIQNKLETLLSTPQATVWEKADSIAVTLSETRRLSKLTGDLMTLARADSAQTLLEKETFDLDALIDSFQESYAELFELEDKTLHIDLQCKQPITADKGRIQELLVILLDNALKYTREGDETTLSTLVQENRVVIQVADTGIGIAEEARGRIFDRFYREDKARSREQGGSGLGLSIAKWIVDTHGGTIKALPNQPKGTIFQVKLPRS